jgi:hypothetical protein
MHPCADLLVALKRMRPCKQSLAYCHAEPLGVFSRTRCPHCVWRQQQGLAAWPRHAEFVYLQQTSFEYQCTFFFQQKRLLLQNWEIEYMSLLEGLM